MRLVPQLLCDDCQHPLTYDASLAGQLTTCPFCGTTFEMPVSEEALRARAAAQSARCSSVVDPLAPKLPTIEACAPSPGLSHIMVLTLLGIPGVAIFVVSVYLMVGGILPAPSITPVRLAESGPPAPPREDQLLAGIAPPAASMPANFGNDRASIAQGSAADATPPGAQQVDSAKSAAPVSLLATLPATCELPPLGSSEKKPLFSLAAQPPGEFRLLLRTSAANLPLKTSLAMEQRENGPTWNIYLLSDSGSATGKVLVGGLELLDLDVMFQWAPTALSTPPAGQLVNCQLEVGHETEAAIVQLRPTLVEKPLVLALAGKEQVLKVSLPESPRPESLRLKLKELVQFPAGAKLRGAGEPITITRPGVVEFSNSKAEIVLRFHKVGAQLEVRVEPRFRDRDGDWEALTLAALQRLEEPLARTFDRTTDEWKRSKTKLEQMQQEITVLTGQPATDPAKTIRRDKDLFRLRTELNRQQKTIMPLEQTKKDQETRLSTLRSLRSLLTELHEKAAVSFTIYAEGKEHDVVLVDVPRPVPAG